MTALHHPGDATMLTYAAGALGEGLSLVVASHLAFCADCRAAVARGEAIGGNLLDELEPAELASDARERVMGRLGSAVPEAPPAPRPRPADRLVPAPLGRYLEGSLATVAWRRVAPGVRQFELLPHDLMHGGNLRLFRIAPGMKLPRHGHSGSELTLVLAGSFSDALGRYGRGDVAETDSEIVHEPLADQGQDCICLIATEGPLKFESLIARVFQRFTGI